MGALLKSRREELGLRQEAVYEVGIALRLYQRLEKGEGNPTYDTLLKLADFLKCDVKELL